ncbi:response regulator [Paraburkholderia sp.]|uniref:response regulator n=1 Tax=Paraburkholderia sp. TaxID=1926495 RepID=UPI002383B56B|nr:response regulator [Paraburkholderia sp.]MDE1181584.1 response regulator [Paraburkholderia sp.]
MSTILLVDDDSESLWAFQFVFERRGHHVLLADEGEAALEKAGRYLPDLIVTDWNMPRMDGIGLCERLKFYPALAQIPVILASGETPPRDKSGLWSVFLSKPVDLAALESVIDALLIKRLFAPRRQSAPLPGPSRWPAMSARYWT